MRLYARRCSLVLAPLCLWLLAGCTTPDTTQAADPYEGCNKVVEPGANDQEALQSALIEANEGNVVCLGEGTFKLTNEVSIAEPGLTVRGQGQDKTILDFSGQTVGANGIAITGDSVTVESFTVKNTPGDGVRATSVKDVVFRKISVTWDEAASLDNGAYGLYPVSSEGVRIEGCTVSGARDAGIYVGQSKRVLVTDSEAFGNVAGIELENTSEAEVVKCRAHDNTGGLLIFNLPNLPVQDGKHALVHDNVFENNNLDNFAEPGTIVATVPRGTGVIILAADANEIRDNTIRGNESAGVLILSYNPPAFPQDPMDPAFDRYPETNFIHDNAFADNGTNPDPSFDALVLAKPVPDVVWDGCVDGDKDNTTGALTNCLMNNGMATFASLNLCTMAGESLDSGPVTCEQPSVVPEAP
ncbi:parallel beta-helix domain-containing protein [Polyangium aurulentum]|uniref:parallel beta-helix domain-containing protein n=1 Tax=Polyangium aurulentum TaxID=2567896 RepID=UPI0010AE27F2|nr:parallel beta-helix domain-containing protein [Polyangium aurulentum]UQA62067.1 right-handed parallel beta-helix repeat-containing protein [Polyangium aurulentum]